jgi:hypothetical protein
MAHAAAATSAFPLLFAFFNFFNRKRKRSNAVDII